MARCENESRFLKMAEAKDWKMEGKKRRITGKEYIRLLNEFELEGLMVQKGLWNPARDCSTETRCPGKKVI